MGTKAGPACLGRCPSGYSGRTRRFVGKELAGCWDPTGHTLRATAGYPISGLRVLWFRPKIRTATPAEELVRPWQFQMARSICVC